MARPSAPSLGRSAGLPGLVLRPRIGEILDDEFVALAPTPGVAAQMSGDVHWHTARSEQRGPHRLVGNAFPVGGAEQRWLVAVEQRHSSSDPNRRHGAPTPWCHHGRHRHSGYAAAITTIQTAYTTQRSNRLVSSPPVTTSASRIAPP